MTAPFVPTLLARRPNSELFGARLGLAVRTLWPAAMVLLLAILAQSLLTTSADVSWLITLCEKMLSGERPYVDFIESNPPAAFLIYMPGTLAARLVGARPEIFVTVFGFVAIAASLALCFLIFDRANLASRIGSPGLAIAIVILALLPGQSFNQREHLALIFGLPLLATFDARASRAKLTTWLSVTAGIGGAVMISIKPHFALMLLAPLPYVCYRVGAKGLFNTTELRTLFIFAALSVALTTILFPAYFQNIVPLVTAVYVPVRTPFVGLLLNQGFLYWLGLALCLLLLTRGRLDSCLAAIPALASAGAVAAFFIQGKGWLYHSYPAVALVTLGLTAGVLENATSPPWLRTLVASIFAAGLTLVFDLGQPSQAVDAQLERLVAASAPHPKILVIGPDIALGFPLTREVGGSWAGTLMNLWITASIDFVRRHNSPDPATQVRYDSYLRFDRETLVSDIRNKSPDAILVQNDKWKTWAFAQADVAAALADYAPVGAVGEVTVYGRKPSLKPTQ